MSMLHPKPGPHSVHTVHRLSALAIGGFLGVFGGLGLAQRPAMLSTEGPVELGMSSNGLLAVISVVVGAILIGSAAIGGNLASTISIALGGVFVLSGFVNGALLGTTANLLAFRLSNVLFSLAVGAVLLITGAWGRLTGGLPVDNPYHRGRHEDDGDEAEDATDRPSPSPSSWRRPSGPTRCTTPRPNSSRGWRRSGSTGPARPAAGPGVTPPAATPTARFRGDATAVHGTSVPETPFALAGDAVTMGG